MHKITEQYLLTVAARIVVDRAGVRWTDRLWAKDLALHLDYIENITLACPRDFSEPADSDVALRGEPFDRIKFVELPRPKNHIDAILSLPETFSKMWGAVGANTIIHTGFGGWPISEGLFAAPMAKLRGKFLITNVESSFWRASESNASWFNAARSGILENLNRRCVNAADLRFFTSQAYLDDFLCPPAERAYVIPATWVDDAIILDDQDALDSWAKKVGPIKLLFAGRLTQEKGINVLLEATRNSDPSSTSITILGEGPLRPLCEALAQTRRGINMLGPVHYGPEFFKLLRQFDAVIVPSISDEQPRIIFDTFSQGVPILGSDTGGIREVVDDGHNGRLVAAGDSSALAELIEWTCHNRAALKQMGLSALQKSRNFTHRAMHDNRSEVIAEALLARPK
jgi:glycosyltransferase involved in cell wall biosynthesis